jgi:hypothetical protein
MHRKDTPAARAALAKRRQRAAQHLNTTTSTTTRTTATATTGGGGGGDASTTAQSSTASSTDNSFPGNDATLKIQTTPIAPPNKKHSSLSASASAIGRSKAQQFEQQQQQQLQQPHWKGLPSNRRPPKVLPVDMNSAAAATTTNATTTNNHNQSETETVAKEQTSSNHSLPNNPQQEYSKVIETLKKPLGGEYTVAGQTVDGTITTAAMTDIDMMDHEPSQKVITQPTTSKIVDTFLSKARSYAEESGTTMGEPNIETILREDGGLDYVQEVEIRHHRRPRNNNTTNNNNSNQQQQPDNMSPNTSSDRYERISDFGFVQVHSPQPPSMSDRRQVAMQSYYPQPGLGSPDIAEQQTIQQRPQQQSSPPLHLPTATHQIQHQQLSWHHNNKDPPASLSSQSPSTTMATRSVLLAKNIHLPSLQSSSTPILQNHQSSKEPVVVNDTDNTIPEPVSHQQQPVAQQESDKKLIALHYSGRKINVMQNERASVISSSRPGLPPTSPAQPIQRPTSPNAQILNRQQATPPTNTIEKATSFKSAPSAGSSSTSVDRLTVSTSGLAIMRKSKIPSPTPINPDGNHRVLPRRNITRSRRLASPDKRLSPQRFTLPPTGRHTSPSQQQHQQQQQQQVRRPQATGPVATSVMSPSVVAIANASRIPTPTTITEPSSVKPNASLSFMSKRRKAALTSTNTSDGRTATADNSILSVSSQDTMDEETQESSKVSLPKQSPRVDRLSELLKESMSVTSSDRQDEVERQQQQQRRRRHPPPPRNTKESSDPVLQSRTDTATVDRNIIMETETNQHPTQPIPQIHGYAKYHWNDDVDDHLDQKVTSWSASKKQTLSPIERYRAAADDYDIQHERLIKERSQQQQQPQSSVYPPQQPTQQRLNQYQFQYSFPPDDFIPRTPPNPQNQRPICDEGYTYESPGHKFHATSPQNGNKIETPPHYFSPLLSHAVVEDDLSNVVDDSEEIADAACLSSGQVVVLRSCQTTTTVQATSKQVLANIDGPDLGWDQELLTVEKVIGDGLTSSPSNLRYGDMVILRSSFAGGKAFGIRKRRNDIQGGDELGFFDVGNILRIALQGWLGVEVQFF